MSSTVSEATNAINIPQSAIPRHIINDPANFQDHGKAGSSAPNLGSSPMMSFSPSKIPSHTLNKFSQDESSGVPLQTSWTFWIDRSSNNSTLSEYKAVGDKQIKFLSASHRHELSLRILRKLLQPKKHFL
jgi:hypothetical protein